MQYNSNYIFIFVGQQRRKRLQSLVELLTTRHYKLRSNFIYTDQYHKSKTFASRGFTMSTTNDILYIGHQITYKGGKSPLIGKYVINLSKSNRELIPLSSQTVNI